MSSFAKFALLTLAAFFVIGFATTADAKRAKLQILKSAPLTGDNAHCLVYNTTETEIYVHLVMFANGGPFVDRSFFIPANTFHYDGDPLGGTIAACEVSWEGQRDDLRATYCADTWIGGDWNNPARTCLEMR